MIWRVIVKYRYNDLYFDFHSLEYAGAFAKNVLGRYKGDDGGKTEINVVIEPTIIIDPTEENK